MRKCDWEAVYCGDCRFSFYPCEYSNLVCKKSYVVKCNSISIHKEYTNCENLNMNNDCDMYVQSNISTFINFMQRLLGINEG